MVVYVLLNKQTRCPLVVSTKPSTDRRKQTWKWKRTTRPWPGGATSLVHPAGVKMGDPPVKLHVAEVYHLIIIMF